MGDSERIIRFGGSDLAEAMYLIGQAWVKRLAGDLPGALEDEAATAELLPPDTIAVIREMIIMGDLPMPALGPGGMDAWLEQCRLAGAGEWKLTRYSPPSAREAQARAAAVPGADPVPHWRRVESEADFLVRLRQIRLDAEAEMKAAWENKS